MQQQPDMQIRDILTQWCKAVAAKDVAQITAIYAPQIRSFDAIIKLQFRGFDVYRAHWEMCMGQCPGPSVFTMTQLEVEATEQLAFSHALIHCGGTNEQGEAQGCWMRTTQCWRKIDGQWRVVHEHFSVPFDMVSNEAMFSLQPD